MGPRACGADAIEDRGIEIEDADETKETIKFAIGDARITINTDRERMTVRVLGKTGTLPLIEAIGGDGVPEIARPAPKLIGKKNRRIERATVERLRLLYVRVNDLAASFLESTKRPCR